MPARYIYLSFFFFIFFATATYCQECKTSLPSLAGNYTGECKNGKAEGIGKAVGEDVYEGMFKAGLPNGQGKYTWKNGDYYEGEWAKGLRQGNGRMIYNIPGKDSAVSGFWKKDAYAGRYEKPFTIYRRSQHVTEISCKYINKTLFQIDLFLNSETGGLNSSFGSPNSQVPKPELTDIQIVTGTYMRTVTDDRFGKKILYSFEDVTFPFRATYTINNGRDFFELEISEAGRWTVEIRTSF